MENQGKRTGRRRWVWAVAMVVLVAGLAVWGISCQVMVPGRSHVGPLPDVTEPQLSLKSRLENGVRMLSETIGERNVQHLENLRRTESFLTQSLVASGYSVARQTYKTWDQEVANLEVERLGQKWPEQILIVGAHYDSFFGTVGANDNASGTAVLLAMADALSRKTLDRTVRFVFFVNEEPPHFQTEKMGSVVYAKRCKERDENIIGAIALDGVGYYSDEANSQHYPFPFSLMYPSTGNFVAVVGDTSSSALTNQVVQAFRKHTKFPSEGAAIPAFVQGAGWSDHWSFWQQGYQGVMITDTLPFRYAHYHKTTDTSDQLNYEKMARVTEGIVAVIEELANRGALAKKSKK
jgi:hypothetical protein